MKKRIWIPLVAVLAILALAGGACWLLWPEPSEPTALLQNNIHAAGHTRAADLWLEVNGKQYYRLADGTLATGFTDIGDQRYYFSEDHTLHTGWLELDGDRYYMKEDGTMAKGQVTLDGVNHFFIASGKYVLLVNRVNPVPADYQTEMVKVESITVSQDLVEALTEMLAAARAEGHPCSMCSGYRSYYEQKYIWDRRVGIFMNEDGYDYGTACSLAANSIMTPGHSEHQTGLAIDFNDSQYGSIKWLREHAWEYGFILRYPPNKSHKTDVMYESWHYRYVGKELAKELYESGLCMEEYMEMLTEHGKIITEQTAQS